MVLLFTYKTYKISLSISNSQAFSKRPQRRDKTFDRGTGDSRADLPNPGLSMRHAGIDHRGDACFDDSPRVDASRRAGEVKRWQSIARVSRQGDHRHFLGVAQGVAGGSSNKTDDGRCGGHGESSQANRFSDCTVAQIRIRVVRAVAGEEKRVGNG